MTEVNPATITQCGPNSSVNDEPVPYGPINLRTIDSIDLDSLDTLEETIRDLCARLKCDSKNSASTVRAEKFSQHGLLKELETSVIKEKTIKSKHLWHVILGEYRVIAGIFPNLRHDTRYQYRAINIIAFYINHQCTLFNEFPSQTDKRTVYEFCDHIEKLMRCILFDSVEHNVMVLLKTDVELHRKTGKQSTTDQSTTRNSLSVCLLNVLCKRINEQIERIILTDTQPRDTSVVRINLCVLFFNMWRQLIPKEKQKRFSEDRVPLLMQLESMRSKLIPLELEAYEGFCIPNDKSFKTKSIRKLIDSPMDRKVIDKFYIALINYWMFVRQNQKPQLVSVIQIDPNEVIEIDDDNEPDQPTPELTTMTQTTDVCIEGEVSQGINKVTVTDSSSTQSAIMHSIDEITANFAQAALVKLSNSNRTQEVTSEVVINRDSDGTVAIHKHVNASLVQYEISSKFETSHNLSQQISADKITTPLKPDAICEVPTVRTDIIIIGIDELNDNNTGSVPVDESTPNNFVSKFDTGSPNPHQTPMYCHKENSTSEHDMEIVEQPELIETLNHSQGDTPTCVGDVDIELPSTSEDKITSPLKTATICQGPTVRTDVINSGTYLIDDKKTVSVPADESTSNNHVSKSDNGSQNPHQTLMYCHEENSTSEHDMEIVEQTELIETLKHSQGDTPTCVDDVDVELPSKSADTISSPLKTATICQLPTVRTDVLKSVIDELNDKKTSFPVDERTPNNCVSKSDTGSPNPHQTPMYCHKENSTSEQEMKIVEKPELIDTLKHSQGDTPTCADDVELPSQVSGNCSTSEGESESDNRIGNQLQTEPDCGETAFEPSETFKLNTISSASISTVCKTDKINSISSPTIICHEHGNVDSDIKNPITKSLMHDQISDFGHNDKTCQSPHLPKHSLPDHCVSTSPDSELCNADRKLPVEQVRAPAKIDSSISRRSYSKSTRKLRLKPSSLANKRRKHHILKSRGSKKATHPEPFRTSPLVPLSPQSNFIDSSNYTTPVSKIQNDLVTSTTIDTIHTTAPIISSSGCNTPPSVEPDSSIPSQPLDNPSVEIACSSPNSAEILPEQSLYQPKVVEPINLLVDSIEVMISYSEGSRISNRRVELDISNQMQTDRNKTAVTIEVKSKSIVNSSSEKINKESKAPVAAIQCVPERNMPDEDCSDDEVERNTHNQIYRQPDNGGRGTPLVDETDSMDKPSRSEPIRCLFRDQTIYGKIRSDNMTTTLLNKPNDPILLTHSGEHVNKKLLYDKSPDHESTRPERAHKELLRRRHTNSYDHRNKRSYDRHRSRSRSSLTSSDMDRDARRRDRSMSKAVKFACYASSERLTRRENRNSRHRSDRSRNRLDTRRTSTSITQVRNISDGDRLSFSGEKPSRRECPRKRRKRERMEAQLCRETNLSCPERHARSRLSDKDENSIQIKDLPESKNHRFRNINHRDTKSELSAKIKAPDQSKISLSNVHSSNPFDRLAVRLNSKSIPWNRQNVSCSQPETLDGGKLQRTVEDIETIDKIEPMDGLCCDRFEADSGSNYENQSVSTKIVNPARTQSPVDHVNDDNNGDCLLAEIPSKNVPGVEREVEISSSFDDQSKMQNFDEANPSEQNACSPIAIEIEKNSQSGCDGNDSDLMNRRLGTSRELEVSAKENQQPEKQNKPKTIVQKLSVSENIDSNVYELPFDILEPLQGVEPISSYGKHSQKTNQDFIDEIAHEPAEKYTLENAQALSDPKKTYELTGELTKTEPKSISKFPKIDLVDSAKDSVLPTHNVKDTLLNLSTQNDECRPSIEILPKVSASKQTDVDVVTKNVSQTTIELNINVDTLLCNDRTQDTLQNQAGWHDSETYLTPNIKVEPIDRKSPSLLSYAMKATKRQKRAEIQPRRLSITRAARLKPISYTNSIPRSNRFGNHLPISTPLTVRLIRLNVNDPSIYNIISAGAYPSIVEQPPVTSETTPFVRSIKTEIDSTYESSNSCETSDSRTPPIKPDLTESTVVPKQAPDDEALDLNYVSRCLTDLNRQNSQRTQIPPEQQQERLDNFHSVYKNHVQKSVSPNMASSPLLAPLESIATPLSEDILNSSQVSDTDAVPNNSIAVYSSESLLTDESKFRPKPMTKLLAHVERVPEILFQTDMISSRDLLDLNATTLPADILEPLHPTAESCSKWSPSSNPKNEDFIFPITQDDINRNKQFSAIKKTSISPILYPNPSKYHNNLPSETNFRLHNSYMPNHHISIRKNGEPENKRCKLNADQWAHEIKLFEFYFIQLQLKDSSSDNSWKIAQQELHAALPRKPQPSVLHAFHRLQVCFMRISISRFKKFHFSSVSIKSMEKLMNHSENQTLEQITKLEEMYEELKQSYNKSLAKGEIMVADQATLEFVIQKTDAFLEQWKQARQRIFPSLTNVTSEPQPTLMLPPPLPEPPGTNVPSHWNHELKLFELYYTRLSDAPNDTSWKFAHKVLPTNLPRIPVPCVMHALHGLQICLLRRTVGWFRKVKFALPLIETMETTMHDRECQKFYVDFQQMQQLKKKYSELTRMFKYAVLQKRIPESDQMTLNPIIQHTNQFLKQWKTVILDIFKRPQPPATPPIDRSIVTPPGLPAPVLGEPKIDDSLVDNILAQVTSSELEVMPHDNPPDNFVLSFTKQDQFMGIENDDQYYNEILNSLDDVPSTSQLDIGSQSLMEKSDKDWMIFLVEDGKDVSTTATSFPDII